MKVAIAGGALQGLEMTCLARKAGYETLLLDRGSDAPATGICHEFVSLDLRDHQALTGALGSVELVFPATENLQALESLEAFRQRGLHRLVFEDRIGCPLQEARHSGS